jgi:hypothetical protein
MDNEKCDKCGNSEFKVIDGVLTCTACGAKHPEMITKDTNNNNNNNNNNNINFNKNLLNFLKDLSINKKILLIMGLVGLVLIVSLAISTTEKVSSDSILNVTDISAITEDYSTLSSSNNYSENANNYSKVNILFDVETNGPIKKYNATVKFYNGNQLIGTYTDSNSYSNNLNNGLNHKTITISSSSSLYGLPKNGTLTDISISFEANINGVNKKLFETPKVNVGSINLYYTEFPNPYYKK